SIYKTVLRVGARLVRDRNYYLAVTDFMNYFLSKFGIYNYDSYYNNLKWIMDVNEKEGNKVAFYFIPQATSTEFDIDSLITLPRVRSLLKVMHNRGHEIGFHPGYMTYKNKNNFFESSKLLRRVLKDDNIFQPTIGGRQHYLRWNASYTPQFWEFSQYNYDSTLGYADKSGFRCGICYEYTMYDLINRRPFRLKQRPLIVMETTVISDEYEGLGYTEEALKRFLYFKNVTKKYSGDFVLLWHNSSFINFASKRIYHKLIS
ncbi:MAG: polysaccharide deacetylase family protein, partial [Candidatus Pacearchaeota archaeon]|nr:polysaccharide deacetylase family protein [Candidatus Pacearchaeota archaeon]